MNIRAREFWHQQLHLSSKRRAQIFAKIRKKKLTHLSEKQFRTRFLHIGEPLFTDPNHYLNEQIKTIYFYDADYPPLLREIYEPPPILFLKGNLTLTGSNHLAIVGTRMMTSYGEKVVGKIVPDLVAAGFIIVSGLAYGIDETAHRETLKNSEKTIAILGSGFDYIYPKRNQALADKIVQNGLLITEYTPKTPPAKWHFPERNRLISGITKGTLIIEAKAKSGSLITANLALEQGREVFAVPGSVFSEQSRGTHQLIQDGAKLVTSSEHIIEEFI